ncbi:Protein argonaute [Ophidiomyces ophidiicola]|uniref:Protein argonaute n=1 Tax=Ophidiomyces ophidiicola TaxID=1387563 RepID=A0ACB8UUL5_9EURO|nr:Protein argonaute [Ophidiomyces ophidiicola]
MSSKNTTEKKLTEGPAFSRNPVFYETDPDQYFEDITLVKRPAFNTTGKEISVAINSYPILQFPTKTIYQYDVLIGNGAEKRAVLDKVWNSKVRQEKLGKFWIFDGNKLAWSTTQLPRELNIVIDLDAEVGRSDSKRSNAFRLVVRETKKINLAILDEYLRGVTSLKDDAQESFNFLDHLLRETPSRTFIPVKRSYFSEDNPKHDLGAGVFAYKGIYQAIRAVHPGKLAVNVDVSNSCFWSLWSLVGLAIGMMDLRDVQQLMHYSKPLDDGYGGHMPSKQFQLLNRLRKLGVRPNYRGCPCPEKEWIIKEFLLVNAKQYTFDVKTPDGSKKTTTIYDYFNEKYNIKLDYWQLPVVQMTKPGVVYPMELLAVYRAQKYPFKLSEFQTAEMIKFAVSRPAERRQAIERCKKNLRHPEDDVLKEYGLKISDTMVRSKARLLPNPEILFGGNQKFNPGTNGRWDLRGKKFYLPNTTPLKSWGVGFFKGRQGIDTSQIESFCDNLVRTYQGHGGDVKTTRPLIMELPQDPAKAVYELFHAVGNKFNQRPQLLILIVQDRHSFHYLRIKKSCDCRFGVPSQVLQSRQVVKNNGQYISNVLMKINAKLGGTTARSNSKFNPSLPPFTMVIGADVSHASPGSHAPSMASFTICMDTFGGRYNAGCETNGERREIISPANIRDILGPLIREWVMNVGKGKNPQNLYYFRDGVSEGEQQHVLQREIRHIKDIFKDIAMGKEWEVKVTVIICSKRHHIRAFPDSNDRNAADKNGNPLPGTLVERDVTNPHGYDFFLWSHVALQGTSRPVHYQVLVDEIGSSPHQLQNMIYEHCYQYMRSTTSVSLFPAVYYAHLASNRARSHENVPASSGPQSGPGTKLNQAPPPQKPAEPPALLPMPAGDKLGFKMWYI